MYLKLHVPRVARARAGGRRERKPQTLFFIKEARCTPGTKIRPTDARGRCVPSPSATSRRPPPTRPPHIRASGAGSVGRRYGTYHAGVRGPHRVWGVCTPPLRHICGRSRAEHRPRGVPEGPEWCCPRPPLADIGTQAFSHPGRARPGAARIGHKKFSIIYTESAVLGLVRHEWQLRKGDLAPGGGVGWSGGLGGGSACACRVGSSTFAPHSLTVSRCRATRRPGRWYFPATSRCREAHLAVGQHPQVRRPLPSPGRCSGCRPRPPFPPSPPGQSGRGRGRG